MLIHPVHAHDEKDDHQNRYYSKEAEVIKNFEQKQEKSGQSEQYAETDFDKIQAKTESDQGGSSRYEDHQPQHDFTRHKFKCNQHIQQHEYK